MVYEFSGIVHLVEETNENNPSFLKRNVIVKNATDYGDRFFTFQFQKDGVNKLDGIAAGQHVKVRFVLEGARQEWNGKFITTVKGLGIEAAGVAEPARTAVVPGVPRQPAAASSAGGASYADVVNAWKKKHGDDKAGLQALFAEVLPEIVNAAKLTGVKVITLAEKNAGSFEKVLAAINGASVSDAPEDDLPF